MKVVIKNKEDVKNVGDAYIINNPNLLYTDNLIVKGDNVIYVVCGSYNTYTNEFDVLDVSTPAWLIRDIEDFSYDALMELAEDDNLGDYAEEVKFTIDK